MSPPSTQTHASRKRRASIVRAARSGISYAMPSGPQIAMIGADDTDAAYELIEIEAVAGSGPPLHVHRDFDESFYALDGELTVRIDGATHVVQPGGVVLIPAGAVHTWKNATTRTIRFLQFTVPGGMEPFTAAVAAAPKPLSLEGLARIGNEHGTTIVGPPI